MRIKKQRQEVTRVQKYLVDVPVRINIWIRPECQRKQFEVLKQARPSILFLISDGGRNEKEWEAIRANRKIFEQEIDWECTVYKLYEDHNNGLYTMSRKGSELIWNTVDRCIFLEDDQLPAVCRNMRQVARIACCTALRITKCSHSVSAVCLRTVTCA